MHSTVLRMMLLIANMVETWICLFSNWMNLKYLLFYNLITCQYNSSGCRTKRQRDERDDKTDELPRRAGDIQVHQVLQYQAGASASLFRVPALHQEDGPPLPLGQQLCRRKQSEVLRFVYRKYIFFCAQRGSSWPTFQIVSFAFNKNARQLRQRGRWKKLWWCEIIPLTAVKQVL